VSEYGVTAYDAQVLTIEREVSEWFDSAAKKCKTPKILANWVISELLREVKELEGGLAAVKITPEQLATLVNLIADNTISGKIAKQVFAEMFETGEDPEKIIKEKGLVQVTDVSAIEPIVREVIAANEKQFAEFKSGNAPKMKGFFVGQVMKKSGGKANPGLVNQILDKLAAE
jgi:aspartyl-tRNA(Asn)/glutamyl-tRNA(Gln) amidotransferase subunit B